MAESCDDARDDFPVAMLADQHMRTRSAIPDRNHQLLGMPKGQNNVTAFTVQRIDRLMPARLAPHRTRNRSNQACRNRRQQRAFDPLPNSLLQARAFLAAQHSAPIRRRFIHPSHPEIATREADGRLRHAAAILRAILFRRWCPGPIPRYDQRVES